MSGSAGRIILVVEDEFLIRFDISRQLREWGYTVVEAANAEEAIAVFDSGTAVDLVFSDINMPGEMDGHDLARWVRARHPHVEIILTSGHAAVAKRNPASDNETLVPKLYDAEFILEHIRELLLPPKPRTSG